MGRSLVPICSAVILFTALVPSPVAADLVEHNVEEVTCWNQPVFDNVVLCVKVTLRFHLECLLGPAFDFDGNLVVPEGFGRCTSISEWYWLGGSVAGLPGEGEGAFGHVFEYSTPGGETVSRTLDDVFPRCVWELQSLGCNARTLAHEGTGLVALAPGDCLAMTLSMYVTAEAWVPSEGSPIFVPEDAEGELGDVVCG